jgi:hypothetical protein
MRIFLTGKEYGVKHSLTSCYGLEASSCQCFIDLGSHLMRVESHHNPDLPPSVPSSAPPSLSLTLLFPPRAAARNYGTNLAPFVLLQVAPPDSILYYTVISTKIPFLRFIRLFRRFAVIVIVSALRTSTLTTVYDSLIESFFLDFVIV